MSTPLSLLQSSSTDLKNVDWVILPSRHSKEDRHARHDVTLSSRFASRAESPMPLSSIAAKIWSVTTISTSRLVDAKGLASFVHNIHSIKKVWKLDMFSPLDFFFMEKSCQISSCPG
ncbi:unnamed protein product [Cochlearia groenlandica]